MFILKNNKRKNLKKIVLSLVVASSLVIAGEEALNQDVLYAEIAEIKAQKSALNDKIKSLESKLLNAKFIARAELGFMQTQGNTNTDIFNLDLSVKKGWSGVHLVGFSFDAQYATDDKVETKNKYLAELDYSYLLTDRLSVTYLFGFKQDKFSGYDYQLYTGPGLKYAFIKTQDHKLTLEGSTLFSEDNIEDTQYDAGGNIIPYPNPNKTAVVSTKRGDVDRYASYRIKGVYGWQILSNLSLIKTSHIDQSLKILAYFLLLQRVRSLANLTLLSQLV